MKSSFSGNNISAAARERKYDLFFGTIALQGGINSVTSAVAGSKLLKGITLVSGIAANPATIILAVPNIGAYGDSYMRERSWLSVRIISVDDVTRPNGVISDLVSPAFSDQLLKAAVRKTPFAARPAAGNSGKSEKPTIKHRNSACAKTLMHEIRTIVFAVNAGEGGVALTACDAIS